MSHALYQEIAALRAEIDGLKAERDQFNCRNNSAIFRLMTHFNLSRHLAAMLACMARGGICSRDALIAATGGSNMAPKSVDVRIHSLRRRIAPIKITNHWGVGYSLEGEHLAAVRRIIRGE